MIASKLRVFLDQRTAETKLKDDQMRISAKSKSDNELMSVLQNYFHKSMATTRIATPIENG